MRKFRIRSDSQKFLSGESTFEELFFDRATKDFGFFNTSGEVIFKVGLVHEFGGDYWYVRIIEDKRESVKLTGASVEVKLRAFPHLNDLLRNFGPGQQHCCETQSLRECILSFMDDSILMQGHSFAVAPFHSCLKVRR